MADQTLRLNPISTTPQIPRTLKTAVIVILAALVSGLATAYLGLIFVPVGLVVILSMILILAGFQAFWKLTIIVILGYYFLSKGFAYVGFFPAYIGESAIAIGVLSLVLVPFSNKLKIVNIRRFFRIEILVLFIFLIWQIAQTVPYIKTYDFDAIRDAMMYGYALYAILIMLLIPRASVIKFFHLFGRVAPYLLVWIPILVIITKTGALNSIRFPNSPYPLFYTKSSDVGVTLAGIGCYMLLQLDHHDRPWSRPMVWICWFLYAFDLLLLGALGRAILVTNVIAIGIILVVRPFKSRWYRPTLLGIIVVSMMLITGTFMTLKIDLGLEREISLYQIVENFSSILGEGNNQAGGLEGTKEFRLKWWDKIIDYTIHGPYFWTGKGYGINLADSDGFQVGDDLRSPHNGHMTVLARSGVPGFALWCIFLALVAMRLGLIAIRRKRSHPWDAKYALWILAYLTAFMVMTSFDVYLESPMGAIPFFSLLGMAYVYFSKDKDDPAEAVPSSQPVAALNGTSSA